MEDKQFLLQRKKNLLLKKNELKKELPHIYGWPWYRWAYNFYTSTNKMNLLCAANQISKSSTQIRKMIEWSTNQTLWPKLWARKPSQFWYLYPSKDVATVEWNKKISTEFMPRGSMKESPYYGWSEEFDKKKIDAVHFNSGVSVYFKTYSQDPSRLQSGSVDAIFCDEELPEDLYPELQFRLAGTQGYFHMVFTATLNQQLWWCAMEEIGNELEKFPKAFKQTISMYDCLTYMDGSPSPWTKSRIQQNIDNCKSKAEVQRRVYGRFISSKGRIFYTFDPSKHYVKPFTIPKSWEKFVAVDIGSGGDEGHPSAIVFIAVRPDYRYGVIYKGWRGDNIETTSGDVLDKFEHLCDIGEEFVYKKYDASAKDFGTISNRLSKGFTKADKSRELGEDIINTLYKNDMLQIFDHDTELKKLGVEMINLKKETAKTKAKDDFCDAQRYCAINIPWDYSFIAAKEKQKAPTASKVEFKNPQNEEEWNQYHDKIRNSQIRQKDTGLNYGNEYNAEIDYWNEQYGS